MFNVQALKARVPLLPLVEEDLGQGKKSGAWVMFRCPFHDDQTPSMGVKDNHFTCFGCGAHGDVITYVMERQGLDFRGACQWLGAPEREPLRPASPAPPPSEEAIQPSPQWRKAATQIIHEAKKRLLHDPSAQEAREYLAARALPRGMWKAGFLGYVPGREYRRLHGLTVPSGILIPWFCWGRWTMINVRRFWTNASGQKYRRVKGGASGDVYKGCTFAYKVGKPVLVTEGEFDALLAWWHVRDLCAVVTLGSASNTQIPTRWLPYFAQASMIVVATDADQAGDRAAARFGALSARVRRLPLPDGQDITDFVTAGGDFAGLIEAFLAGETTARGPDRTPARQETAQQAPLFTVPVNHRRYEI